MLPCSMGATPAGCARYRTAQSEQGDNLGFVFKNVVTILTKTLDGDTR